MQRPTGIRQRRQRVERTGKRQGLTPLQVQQVLTAQQGACALCLRPLGDAFVIDHDHALAEVHGHDPLVGCPRCFRGALCHDCNGWLRGFRDDPTFLRRAAAYAERRRTA